MHDPNFFPVLFDIFKKLKFCCIYRRFHYTRKLFVEYYSKYICLSYIINFHYKSTPFIILHYLQPIAESNFIRRSGPNQAFQAIPYAVQRSGIVNNSSWKVILSETLRAIKGNQDAREDQLHSSWPITNRRKNRHESSETINIVVQRLAKKGYD